jgi:hypothetical protein
LLGFGEPEPVKVRIETCKREYEIELALGKAAVGRQLSWQLQSDRKTKRKLRRLRPVPPAQSARNILDRIDASKREIIQNGKHFATSSPAASDSLEVAE